MWASSQALPNFHDATGFVHVFCFLEGSVWAQTLSSVCSLRLSLRLQVHVATMTAYYGPLLMHYVHLWSDVARFHFLYSVCMRSQVHLFLYYLRAGISLQAL